MNTFLHFCAIENHFCTRKLEIRVTQFAHSYSLNVVMLPKLFTFVSKSKFVYKIDTTSKLYVTKSIF